jgi:predicted site-specific integrase-resolvase
LLLRISDIENKYKLTHNSLKEWEKKGFLKSYKTPGGHRRYLESDIQHLLEIDRTSPRVAIYGRVSTKKQEENLNRQVERLKQYCKEKGYESPIEFIEIASGLNDKRRQFHKMVDAVIRKEINLIVVEYKDRLSRFGLRLIYHFFEGLGCKIEVIETESSKDENKELVDDMLALITSFSARLYGKRGGRKKLKEDLNI